jgi:hypothetical protein
MMHFLKTIAISAVRTFLFITAIIVLILATSCNAEHSDHNGLETRKIERIKKADLNCINGHDTEFLNHDYLRFVAIGDTAFDAKVNVGGGAVGLLGFGFTCDMPTGLIPSVLDHSSGKLILIRGYGFHYREIIICSSRSGLIYQRRFETELSIGAKYDCAYPDPNDSLAVIVVDLSNKKNIVLRMGRPTGPIKLFRIDKDSLSIVDSSGKESTFKIKRTVKGG